VGAPRSARVVVPLKKRIGCIKTYSLKHTTGGLLKLPYHCGDTESLKQFVLLWLSSVHEYAEKG